MAHLHPYPQRMKNVMIFKIKNGVDCNDIALLELMHPGIVPCQHKTQTHQVDYKNSNGDLISEHVVDHDAQKRGGQKTHD